MFSEWGRQLLLRFFGLFVLSSFAPFWMARLSALLPLLIAVLVGTVSAADFVLLDDSSPATIPIVGPFPFNAYQYTPSLNQNWLSVLSTAEHEEHDETFIPLYFGNSFRISNVRPQNDTFSTKRLQPIAHFAMLNQTISIEGQEYLIRPRAYVNHNIYGKRAPDSSQLPLNAQDLVSSPFTVTPSYAAFRIANSSNGEVAFFDQETVMSEGASFEIRASNPSAFYWNEPGGQLWNTSDAASWSTISVGGVVDIDWLVACRWIENQTDCAPSPDLGPCEYYEFGLCWARSIAPSALNFENAAVYPPVPPTDSIARPGDWSLWVGPRALGILDDSNNEHLYKPAFIPHRPQVHIEVAPNQPSGQLVVFLPKGLSIPDRFKRYWKQFLPGKDNAGGELIISVRTIIALLANGSGVVDTNVVMDPPSVTLSKDTMSASFRFLSAPFYNGLVQYEVFFQVTETAASTEVQLNSTTNATISSFATYPNGAYLTPSVVITPCPYEIAIENWPSNGTFSNIRYPIFPPNLLDCANPGPSYIARLSASPAQMGVDYVRLPFSFDPSDAIQFWTCPTGSSKRQQLPLLIDHLIGLEFVGDNTAVVFYMTTQALPVLGVTLQFLTPTVSDATLIDPAAISFPQNGTYLFDIVRNSITVELVADSAPDAGSVGGPYLNDPFYFRFKWTPPVANGFLLAITGFYSVFENAERVSSNSTYAEYRVKPGATGFLLGPIRVPRSPGNTLLNNNLAFDVVYTITLLAGSSTSFDQWTYELPGPIQIVTVLRHIFAVITTPGTVSGLNNFPSLPISTLGFPSAPICVGPAFSTALTNNTSVWLSLVELNTSCLILDPLVISSEVRPPNSIKISAASPVACFTLRFDTNWTVPLNKQSIGDALPLVPSIELRVAGPDNLQYVDFVNIPFGIVVQPSQMGLFVGESSFEDSETSKLSFAGDTQLVWVTLAEPTARGVSYNLTYPAGIVTAIDAGAGRFVPNGSRQHLWSVIHFVFPVSEGSSSHDGDEAQDFWDASLQLIPAGSDAALVVGNSYSFHVVLRELLLAPSGSFGEEGEDNVVLGQTRVVLTASIQMPVIKGLTLTPSLRASGAASGHVSFTPASFTFVPGGATTMTFAITGEVLTSEDVEWSWAISGPDAVHYRYNNIFQRVSVTRRPPPMIEALPSNLQEAIATVFTILLAAPAAPSEDLTIEIEHDPEVSLSAEIFDGRLPIQQFSAVFVPSDRLVEERSLAFRMRLAGADAWKYSMPLQPLILTASLGGNCGLDVAATAHVVGVRYSGSVSVFTSRPAEVMQVTLGGTGDNVQFFTPGASTGSPLLPLDFTIGEKQKYFEYVVTSQLSSPVNTNTSAPPSSVKIALFAAGNTGCVSSQSVSVVPRTFYLNTRRESAIDAPESSDKTFMVNHVSALQTVVLTAPPENSVTLTISHPNLRFNKNQQVVALRFAAGQLTASFTFTPVSVPNHAEGDGNQWSLRLSGADANLYDYSDLVAKLQNHFWIIPDLRFSPIPPIFTDGSATGLRVFLADGLKDGFPLDAFHNFALKIAAESGPKVVFQPEQLEFSKESLSNNRLSQEFSIVHTSPASFGASTQYSLKWWIRYAGRSTWFEISEDIPLDARQVLLKRYQIIPDFPRKLNFKWQDASFNLTRSPIATVALIPFRPYPDNVYDAVLGHIYAGARVPGGVIVFDPPNVVFGPGQQVAHFRMKAMAGTDRSAVYYRVDWFLEGYAEELCNYIDYVAPRSSTENTYAHFSSWHIASGLRLSMRFSVLSLLAVLLLLL